MAEICVKKEIDDELVMENEDSVNSLNGNQTDIISKHTDNMQTVSIKSENKWDDIETIEPPVTKYEKFQYPNHNVFEKCNEEVSENTKINKSVVSKNESGPEGIFIKKEITEEFIIKDELDLMQVDSLENTQLPESDRYFSSVAGPSATHKSDMEITESTSFSGELESVLNFEPEEETCILCQTTGGVINVSERTCATFIKAFELRSENDTEIDANMHNIVLQLKTNWQNIQWHNRCYTSYTSKKNIEVFRNRIRTLQEYQELGIRPPNPSQRFLRKNPFDIKKCVFCQKKKLGKRLSQVMSKNIESKIRNVGNKNFEILKRIGMNDLIAMKVKYHPGCLVVEMRNASEKLPSESNKNEIEREEDVALSCVISEMENGIQKGEEFAATSIFKTYLALGGFRSKRFVTDAIKNYFGSKIEVIKSEKATQSSIFKPSVSKPVHSYMETTSTSSEKESTPTIGSSELSQIHKICLDIRNKIDQIPEYLDYTEMDITAYKKYIPQDLISIVSLIISASGNEENIAVLSICQDIIYNRWKGKRFTPKHIGIGTMLHQETRSKKIIETMHACGHSISYKDVLRLRNSIAQEEISRYLDNDHCYIPRQLVSNRFIQFAADNIDVLEDTLNKSPTFHGTQIITFQKGPPNLETTRTKTNISPWYKQKLRIPENFHLLRKINYNQSNKPIPKLTNKNILCEYQTPNFIFSYNFSWVLCRTSSDETNAVKVPQWSEFGKLVHRDESHVTTYGYLPLLPYISTDYDTVWTILKMCSNIATKLNNDYTVITFDQAIYQKAKEIQWLKPDECSHFVIRLGGFHIMMNFLKAIGQHMENSGLRDVWVESNLYEDASVSGIMDGKKWSKAIRAHTLTYESLLRILLPMFESWLKECKSDQINVFNESRLMASEVCKVIREQGSLNNFFSLVNNVKELSDAFMEFIEFQSATFKFWCSYMEMVEVLLEFLYSERTGNWDLHLQSLRKMLPWFFTYNHDNYARWGSVYLCDMLDLVNKAPGVHQEFCKGEFVIKRSNGSFNKISVDQALEHVNKTSKDVGGINSTSLDEWYLSFNDVERMVENFMLSLKLKSCISSKNIEIGKRRIIVDEEMVSKLLDQFLKYDVFTNTSDTLISISTKEVYSKISETFRMNAKQNGETSLKSFMDKIDTEQFYKPLKRNNPVELSNNIKRQSFKQSQAVDGQQLQQKILAAKEMGRTCNYNEIFQHELTTFPMSLTVNGQLAIPSNTDALCEIIESFYNAKYILPDAKDIKTCLIIDGMSLVQRMGKPTKCKTFGEYFEMFASNIFNNKLNAQRIDVVFDYYKEDSIKRITRLKRELKDSIQTILENEDTPLPQSWNLFMHSIFNKQQLTNFLSEKLVHYFLQKPIEFVTSGGLNCITEYRTNCEIGTPELITSNHEEAHTRTLLHILSAKQSGFSRCIIDCNDTDMLILLLHFRQHLTPEVWMKVRKGASWRYIPIHEICLSEQLIQNLPAFHALTGCDTTSQFTGIGKKSCWKIYLEYYEYLNEVGVAEFSDEIFSKMQSFVIKLYSKETNIESINTLRGIMAESTPISKLPPSKDVLKQHCLRAYYQTKIWKNSLRPLLDLPGIEQFGWYINKNGNILPVLTTLPPSPTQLKVLSSCGCKKDCAYEHCFCQKNGMTCIASCKCMIGHFCKNPLTTAKESISTNETDLESSEEDL